jgi:hypothetical protein
MIVSNLHISYEECESGIIPTPKISDGIEVVYVPMYVRKYHSLGEIEYTYRPIYNPGIRFEEGRQHLMPLKGDFHMDSAGIVHPDGITARSCLYRFTSGFFGYRYLSWALMINKYYDKSLCDKVQLIEMLIPEGARFYISGMGREIVAEGLIWHKGAAVYTVDYE